MFIFNKIIAHGVCIKTKGLQTNNANPSFILVPWLIMKHSKNRYDLGVKGQGQIYLKSVLRTNFSFLMEVLLKIIKGPRIQNVSIISSNI